MESLIERISISVSPELVDELKEYLSKSAVDKLLKKNAPNLLTFLEALDPNLHTLGYSRILAYVADNVEKLDPMFINKASNFLLRLGDVRLCKAAVGAIGARLTTALIEGGTPAAGIAALRSAVRKCQGKQHTLTKSHADFVLLCISSQNYKAAKEIIQKDVFEIAKGAGVTAKDSLLYHYYAGHALIGLKDFPSALEYFQLVLTSPTQTLSKIQIEAFKKYILCCLFVHGKFVELPKFTSRVVVAGCQKCAGAYEELAKTMRFGIESLGQAIETHHEDFQSDNNLGLVKQVRESLVRRSIKNLTNTYITLSLGDLAQKASLEPPTVDHAKKVIAQMIESGDVFATISEAEGMVAFKDDPEDFASPASVQRMDARLKQAIRFCDIIRQKDAHVSKHPDYIRKTMRRERSEGGLGGDDEDISAEDMRAIREAQMG